MIAGLVAASLLAIVWSLDAEQAVIVGARLVMFVGGLLVVWRALDERVNALSIVADASLLWVALQSVLTVAFRLDPSVEAAFYASPAMVPLLGSTGLALTGEAANNVIDPEKAGGLIVNGNAASLLLGISAVSLLAANAVGPRIRFRLVGLTAFAAVFFTGSKTGAVLAVIVPLVVVALRRAARSRSGRRELVVLAPFAAIAAILLPTVLQRVFPVFSTKSEFSFDTRMRLWGAALDLFRENPILGLGFGGWKPAMERLIGRSDWPPHNVVISAWADAGLVAAALTVAFIAITLGLGLRRLMLVPESPGDLTARCWAWSGMLWVFSHGMGDNTSVYGEPRSLMLAATLFCVSLWPSSMPSPPVPSRRSALTQEHLPA
ncbi:O-antigen ligase family protein [Nocardioides pinisoli]|uniref:O-antigen ligase family protein n=1 Tax=Nocardioides pinisoli TaxID=2950279 RepID=A0ABT1KWD6_9ACTN|nr:O-antigen ligase family protein [Nocardioides pinisoli]MCP3420921.1 O-antigen ligase family protein [Nocardioides pinisoli]